jgi:class 3 adenylate cyclase
MTTRRLAAILAADVVGFSTMMERTRRGPHRTFEQ